MKTRVFSSRLGAVELFYFLTFGIDFFILPDKYLSLFEVFCENFKPLKSASPVNKRDILESQLLYC